MFATTRPHLLPPPLARPRRLGRGPDRAERPRQRRHRLQLPDRLQAARHGVPHGLRDAAEGQPGPQRRDVADRLPGPSGVKHARGAAGHGRPVPAGRPAAGRRGHQPVRASNGRHGRSARTAPSPSRSSTSRIGTSPLHRLPTGSRPTAKRPRHRPDIQYGGDPFARSSCRHRNCSASSPRSSSC